MCVIERSVINFTEKKTIIDLPKRGFTKFIARLQLIAVNNGNSKNIFAIEDILIWNESFSKTRLWKEFVKM